MSSAFTRRPICRSLAAGRISRTFARSTWILLALFTVPSSPACPICLGIIPQAPTLADEIRGASDVIVGQPSETEGTFTIQSILKGAPGLAGQSLTPPEGTGGGPRLFSRASDTAPWRDLGKAALYLQPFVRTTLQLPAGQEAGKLEWNTWLPAFRPFLGHADERIARSAWDVWARAPYAVLRDHAALADPETLHRWLEEPSLSGQRNLWIVLLGFSGGAAAAEWLEARRIEAWKTNSDAQLAALLTACLERKGPSMVEILERDYFADRRRTLPEIQAAVAALSVHAKEDGPDMRQSVIACFRRFVELRRPLAGLVARDLAEWEQWDLAPRFASLLTSSEPVYPSTRPAIMDYLKACPDPVAREALDRLPGAGR